MKFFSLRHAYDKKGDPVSRAVCVASEDRKKLLEWYVAHRKGRSSATSAFGTIRFKWNGPKEKQIVDFPPGPHSIFSAKAIKALRAMLEASGDIYPVDFENREVDYFLFDCWSFVCAKTNKNHNGFRDGSLKYLKVENSSGLPDVFVVKEPPILSSLFISERFKEAAEQAGLSGMVFTEVEILDLDQQ